MDVIRHAFRTVGRMPGLAVVVVLVVDAVVGAVDVVEQ